MAYGAEEASLDPSLSEKDEIRTRSVSEVVIVDLAHDGVVPDDDILSLSSLCGLLEGSAGRQRSVSPQPSRRTQRLSSRRKGLRLTVVRYESYSAWISSGVLVGGDCRRRDEEAKDLVAAEGSELDGLDEWVRETVRAMERANMMGFLD